MLREAARTARRYGTEKSLLAERGVPRVRWRGLLRGHRLTVEDDPAPPSWALGAYRIRLDGRDLRAPGTLEFDLSAFPFPARTFRDPFEVVEAYQELSRDGDWLQLVPTRRDPARRRLVVHQDRWGTGRIALAYRLEQPHALVRMEENPVPEAPDLVVLHGVDAVRSDYSGPRDLLAFASAVGRRVDLFQYPSGRPVAENAAVLKSLLEASARNDSDPPRRRILLGYSMGGLVARYALEELGLGMRVDDLILLATPSRGAEWVGVLGHLPALSVSRDRVFSTWRGVRDFLPGSPLVLDLSREPRHRPGTRYLALAGICDGNGDLVVDADSVDLPPIRRPADYRFRWRKNWFDLNRYSHWGVHQEFLANGLGREAADWLGLALPESSHRSAAKRRRARIGSLLDEIRESAP